MGDKSLPVVFGVLTIPGRDVLMLAQELMRVLMDRDRGVQMQMQVHSTMPLRREHGSSASSGASAVSKVKLYRRRVADPEV